MLTKDSIFKADDLPREEVAIPEWNGSVWVRTLTGRERDQFESSCVTNKGKSRSVNMDNIRARLCVLTVCNEKGDRLFDQRDVEKLGNKSSRCLDLIFSVAQKLNGLSSDDVDDLAKN